MKEEKEQIELPLPMETEEDAPAATAADTEPAPLKSPTFRPVTLTPPPIPWEELDRLHRISQKK